MMKWLGLSGTLVLSLGAMACSGNDELDKKEITRIEVADSSFKPTGLEDTIDGLVEELAKTERKEFKASVIMKLHGDDDTYWEPVKVGANRAIGELELNGQAEAPSSNAEDIDFEEVLQAQIDLTQDRVASGAQGIALAAVDAGLTDTINSAVADGVVVVTFDGDVPDSDRLLYVGTNNREAGYTAGQTLAALIPESEGTVYCLGTTSVDWVDGFARTSGAAEALEEAGYTAIMDDVGWGGEGVQDDIDMLVDAVENADPPLVGIIGMFSNSHRGAEAAVEAGLEPGDIKIVGFDFDATTLEFMDQGYMQATHAQRQYYMGYLLPYVLYSIDVLGLEPTKKLLVDHMVDGSRFDTGIDVVLAEDLDEFNSFLDSLGIGG